MAGRRRNGQTSWDNDFKAGYAAGKRAYAKRPDTVSASDGARHYSRVSSRHGAQWKSGFNAALDVARGATLTKNAIKALRLMGLTSSGRDRAMASRYEADQYGRASRSHKANGRKKNSNWAARLSVAQQQRGMVVAPRKNAAFGTVKYVKTPRGWYVTYVGDSTRHGPFPTKKSAVDYQTTPQHGKYGENPRRKNARKYNTHLKVGQRVAYTPMPGVFGKISKAYSKGDLYDVTWEASGQTQPKLPGNKLKKATKVSKADFLSGHGLDW